jgi:uncharacterized Zn finger protein (UPF0148 family)
MSTVYHCPVCGTVLEDGEGQFWCPEEERAVPFGELVHAEEGDDGE